MLFNSFEFCVFFIIVFGLYLVLKHKWQNRLLIIASCAFYAGWNWKFLGIMFVSISADFFCAKKIYSSRQPKARRFFLALSIIINLAILGFFKYFNFFAANFESVLRSLHLTTTAAYLPLRIILPLGISFYTFEAISYTVDVYRGLVKPAKSYGDYLLFVIYFPHLVAGPIMRAKSFLPQITTPRKLSLEQFYQGSFLFFWGLFEKMFVADNLAKIVNPVFASPAPYKGGLVLIALYAFAFQIFCDFDGYSNMARGLGKCMGFDITINFKLPYFCVNPREFWQRWHISLSSWLRDYLYIPLGGSRAGQARMLLALFLTMLLGGLWHGAAWTFILWGLYQGLILIVHRLYVKNSGSISPNGQRISLKYVIKLVFFFHLVVLGWLLFRAQSFTQIIQMLQGLFFNFSIGSGDIALGLRFGGFIALLLLVQTWQYKSGDLMIIYKQHWLLKTAFYAFMAYLLIGWGVMKAEEFIYFQF